MAAIATNPAEDLAPKEISQQQAEVCDGHPQGAVHDAVAASAPANDVVLVDVPWLKAHEEFIPTRLKEIMAEVKAVNAYQWPLLVDAKSGVVLDGHHRHQTSLALKLKKVPAVLIDYVNDDRISVVRWRKDLESWQSKGLPDAISSGSAASPTPGEAVRCGSECYTANSFAKSPSKAKTAVIDDLLVTKEEVVRRGLAGTPYPPKSTRHLLREGLTLPKVYVPLSQLY